jgi:signal recognition particle receptor subunit beta
MECIQSLDIKTMGKISKIVVCGHTGVGKTAAIEQLIFGNHIIGTVRSKFLAQMPLLGLSNRTTALGMYSVLIPNDLVGSSLIV